MDDANEGKEVVPYRGPKPVVAWLRRRAAYLGSTTSAEITAAVRERMEREQEARADRAAGE
jgi:hypothetical protein